MKKIGLFSCLMLCVILSGSIVSANAVSPQNAVAKKYPRERISILKSSDINGDKKSESFIVGGTGNFYYVDSAGRVNLADVGIVSDDGFAPPTVQFFSPDGKTKQVAVTYDYGPSNTVLLAYKMVNGNMVNTLNIMGDQGVKIDSKGRVHQYWKHYKDQGGWDMAEAVYTWNSAAGKYKGSGQLP